MNIGEKVKELRKSKNFTIKQFSEMTGLSTGFISQFERGITTIDVNHLTNIAQLLDEDIAYFFESEKRQVSPDSVVVRGYERSVLRTMNQAIYLQLSSQPADKQMSPKLIELLPSEIKEKPTTYHHDGEEFIFILEGILTFYLEDEVLKLYPGDAAHFLSTREHNWGNLSDNVVKFLVVHFPNTDN